jgi:hypothetical protein
VHVRLIILLVGLKFMPFKYGFNSLVICWLSFMYGFSRLWVICLSSVAFDYGSFKGLILSSSGLNTNVEVC